MISRTEQQKSVLLSLFMILVEGWQGRGQSQKHHKYSSAQDMHSADGQWSQHAHTWASDTLISFRQSFHLLGEIRDPVRHITQLHQICMIHSPSTTTHTSTLLARWDVLEWEVLDKLGNDSDTEHTACKNEPPPSSTASLSLTFHSLRSQS